MEESHKASNHPGRVKMDIKLNDDDDDTVIWNAS